MLAYPYLADNFRRDLELISILFPSPDRNDLCHLRPVGRKYSEDQLIKIKTSFNPGSFLNAECYKKLRYFF
jgi:hypothetical protein